MFNQKDEEQFKLFYNRYAEKVTKNAFFYLKDLPQAEDIVSEAFTDIWLRNAIFKTERHAVGYLYLCIKSKCINYIKRSKWVRGILDEYAAQANGIQQQLDVVNKNNIDDYITSAPSLSQKEKLVLLLALDNVSKHKIHQKTGIPKSTVIYAHTAAIKKIKKAIKFTLTNEPDYRSPIQK
jgi:RNA polymerase sigma-70 factor (ECF subfamily)